MLNLILSVVIVLSGIWVYLDATKNEIGKIADEKSFFNLHAGGWALVVLLLWIVGFPVYLIKRKNLIEKAYENPVYVSGKGIKIFGLFLIGLLIIAGSSSQYILQNYQSIYQQDEKISEESNERNSAVGTEEISCSEDEVKQLVLEVTNEELFELLIQQHIDKKARKIEAELKDTSIWEKYTIEVIMPWLKNTATAEERDLYMMTGGGILPDLPKEYFFKFAAVSPEAQSIAIETAQQLKNMHIDLDAIRVIKKQPDINKVACAADIIASDGNNRHSIQYTAQITEDGQIYVEVSGL